MTRQEKHQIRFGCSIAHIVARVSDYVELVQDFPFILWAFRALKSHAGEG